MNGREEVPVADALHVVIGVLTPRFAGPLVLAVSGGRDSMALLHAMARFAPGSIAAVATFDHGTGAAATEAAAVVAAESRRLGLSVVRERARNIAPTESAWRSARWSFLNRVARGFGARVATAHSRDDQAETIFMRLLRGSGTRGLAALASPSPIVRPFLALSRAELTQWVMAERIPFVDDPSNATRQYFRSRVRHELLPAINAVQPGFTDELIALGERAAGWRRDVESLVDQLGIRSAPVTSPDGALRIPASELEGCTDEGLSVLWPALMGRVGVAVNRKGTGELVRFTHLRRTGMRQELSGNASVVRVREGGSIFFELRPNSRASGGLTGSLPVAQNVRFDGWHFAVVDPAGQGDRTNDDSLWVMPFPGTVRLSVRAWQNGDRIRTEGAPAGRRVARYLSEAGVPAVDRRHWPVVLIGDDIVWVPGVCRSLAAPNRPGRPDLTWYRCEREHGRPTT